MKPSLKYAAAVLLLAALLLSSGPAAWATPAEQALSPGLQLDNRQSQVHFGLLKSEGIRVVYLKAAEGEQAASDIWQEQARLAREYHLRLGFYQELTARTVEEGQAQARYFAALLADQQYDCLPALQLVEQNELSPELLSEILLAYQQTMLEALGYPALIQAAPATVQLLDTRLSAFPLWLAQPNQNQATELGAWTTWAAREENASGSLPGLEGEVRLQRFTAEVLLHNPGKAHIGVLIISALVLLLIILGEVLVLHKHKPSATKPAA